MRFESLRSIDEGSVLSVYGKHPMLPDGYTSTRSTKRRSSTRRTSSTTRTTSGRQLATLNPPGSR
jgi:hypothetical protein